MMKKHKYWLSLEEWRQDKHFQESVKNEFISPLPSEGEQKGWHRRDFLKLMGASMALAGFGCVRRPTEKIVPYVKRPDDTPLGQALFYSSSYYDGEEGFGILVKTREGRPIKIEGNRNHPSNRGALSARAHSHLLSLYDPQRLKAPRQNLFNENRTNKEAIALSYEEADQTLLKRLKKGRLAFLTGQWPSPSSQELLRDFCQKFACRRFVHHPLSHQVGLQAQKLCYGVRARLPHYRIDRARFIVSINCDFLGTFLSPTEFNRLYGKGRRADRDMNRLVVFESLMSLTGTNADLRVRVRPSQQVRVVLGLISSLLEKTHQNHLWPPSLQRPGAVWKELAMQKQLWDQVVEDLWNHRGQSLVMTGGPASQSAGALSLHIAVEWLNHLLAGDGWTPGLQSSLFCGFSGRGGGDRQFNIPAGERSNRHCCYSQNQSSLHLSGSQAVGGGFKKS